MKKLIEALLNDDHGISEEAYNALLDVLDDEILEAEYERHKDEMIDLRKQVTLAEATDGRFYFS